MLNELFGLCPIDFKTKCGSMVIMAGRQWQITDDRLLKVVILITKLQRKNGMIYFAVEDVLR